MLAMFEDPCGGLGSCSGVILVEWDGGKCDELSFKENGNECRQVF